MVTLVEIKDYKSALTRFIDGKAKLTDTSGNGDDMLLMSALDELNDLRREHKKLLREHESLKINKSLKANDL